MGYIKRKILYVDDDPSARALLQAMLRQMGYIVEPAQDGFEAIEFLHKYAYDLILLDIMMPKMTGFDFLKRIRGSEATKTIPVIILSQMDDKKSVQRCLELGADDYVIKPPDRKTLAAKLQRVLGQRPRFAEVSFAESDQRSQGALSLNCQILSIGETGIVMRSPLPLDKIPNFQMNLPILEKLGIKAPRLRINQVAEENGQFLVYFTYAGLSDEEVRLIRSWVVEENLKLKSA